MTIERNKNYYLHLATQCFCATIFILIILVSLNIVLANDLIWAAGASTLASSAYIVFGSPQNPVAKPYRILTGYLIAIVCGYLLQVTADHLCYADHLCNRITHKTDIDEVAAAISVGLSFLLMFILRASHPPAAGLAVVVVLDINNPAAIAVICTGALVLALVRWIFSKQLKQLI